MKKLESFLKYSEIENDNIKFVVDENIKDEEGNPIEWELRKLKAQDGKEAEDAAFKLNIETQEAKFDQRVYRNKIMAMTVFYPDLNNAELQNAFGVHTPEDLLGAMLDIGSYQKLEKKVTLINGFGKSFTEAKDKAKN
ncbi:hypothetical protein NSA24_10145 [Clostridioides mangenotii]|uniref:phage tail assembly chaperone n=1 Tax=Metaclostridioides mangenotii TaxID=1540 RepID=UPI00214A849D|nr:hypothetical protein [Clostridioides mangenotii]MCR1955152.1 hypothetical protein [Clostridioides mangenotii]